MKKKNHKNSFQSMGIQWLVFLFFCFSTKDALSQILIMVPVYNRPDFIELQCKTFAKFLKDDYQLLYLNDADDPVMEKKIEEMCNQYFAPCVRVPQEIHPTPPRCRASFRHGEVLDYALSNFGFKHNDLFMFLDSDMFLIQEFSIREYLGDRAINCYVNAIWPHFSIFNPALIVHPEKLTLRARIREDGHFVDVAEETDPWVLSQPSRFRTNVLWGIHRDISLDPSQETLPQLLEKGYAEPVANLIKQVLDAVDLAIKLYPDKQAAQIRYDCDIALYENGIFLDYKHGSGWNGPIPEIQAMKDAIVKGFINQLLQQ